MQGPTAIDPQLFNLGLFLIRLVFGLAFAAHGAQKLFGWFGGYGIAGTGGFLESLGFRPGKMFATASGLGEFFGGLLFAFGFLGAVGPAFMLSGMLVASISVHLKNGFFATSNGVELPLLYAVAGIGIALTGPGLYSLDAALGNYRLLTPNLTWIFLALGLIGGIGSLALRRPSPSSPAV